jgi:hypothetical protein
LIKNAKREVCADVKLRREQDHPKQKGNTAYALFPARHLHFWTRQTDE